MSASRIALAASFLAMTGLATACAPLTGSRDAGVRRVLTRDAAPPRFADAARRTKFAAAFVKIDEQLREGASHRKAPGLAIGVVVDGELAWAGGYGLANVATGAGVTQGSVFRLYSITKTITALAILQLRDDGRLSLDEPAQKYVPELAKVVYPEGDSAPITIRDLLSHNAGLPHFGTVRPSDEGRGLTEKEILGGLDGLALAGTPGVSYKYSSLGYSILGVIIHRVSGVPYREYVSSRILAPLGMTSSTFEPALVARDRLAVGYDDVAGEGVAVAPDPGFGDDAPEGGLFTSIEDLARYAAFELSGWPPRSGPESSVLRRSSVREMQRAASYEGLEAWRVRDGRGMKVRAQAFSFGLGWALRETCDVDRIVQFEGGDHGYHSTIDVLPDYGVAIVTLQNLGGASSAPARAALRILRESGALTKRAITASEPLRAARERAAALLEQWNDAEARATFRPRQMSDLGAIRKQFEGLHRDHGRCHLEGEIVAKTPSRGEWKEACERGSIALSGELVSTLPVLEDIDATGMFPPGDAMTSAAGRAASLVAGWSAQEAAAAFDGERASEAFRRAASGLEGCHLGAAKRGDGRTESVFALGCSDGERELDVEIDERSGKITGARIEDPDGVKCPE